MNISNKSARPISVPLPNGKKLFLGPGKTGQINPKAAAHPPLVALVEAGDLTLDDSKGQRNSTASNGPNTWSKGQDGPPSGSIRRTGDR